ncbi:hypothetical protein [Actinomadura sp. 3N407]|uniref:hypothetical protein n=1 Tax=Actinomadura sp. 3N407 TaxID=3457423 RepID=UPI003FCDCD20
MENVLGSPPPGMVSAEDMAKLDELRTAFPAWTIGWSAGRNPWYARRKRGPGWRGGAWALEAESQEMMRDLLGGVEAVNTTHAAASVAAAARRRLGALAERLRGHGLIVDLTTDLDVDDDRELDGGTARVALTVAVAAGAPVDVITCQARESDEGRLWFYNGAGEPIEQASHVVDATLVITAAVTADAEVSR